MGADNLTVPTLLTPDQLRAIFPNAADPDAYAAAISTAWDAFGFTSKGARAGFLGVIGNETGGCRQIGREDMRYSAERAISLPFAKAAANPETTRDRCSTVPQDKGRRFASWIYADMYGNGPEATEDGWNYRGGGMVQLTFRSAYRACGAAIGINLEANPDLIVTPGTAALSAAWFMSTYKPAIIHHFDHGTQDEFLSGAALVGWTNPEGTATRLGYWARAMATVDGDPPLDVRRMQMALMAAGFDLPRFGADGDLGSETRAALHAYQHAHSLPATGTPDAATLAALGLKAA